jgi:hypothetical protein
MKIVALVVMAVASPDVRQDLAQADSFAVVVFQFAENNG